MGEMEHKYSDVGELISVTTDSHGFANSTIATRELKEHAKCSLNIVILCSLLRTDPNHKIHFWPPISLKLRKQQVGDLTQSSEKEQERKTDLD